MVSYDSTSGRQVPKHKKKVVIFIALVLLVSGLLLVFVPYKHIKIDMLNVEGTDIYFSVDIEYWAFQGINLRFKKESEDEAIVTNLAYLLTYEDDEWKVIEHEYLEVIPLDHLRIPTRKEYTAKVANFFGVMNRFKKYRILVVVSNVLVDPVNKRYGAVNVFIDL